MNTARPDRVVRAGRAHTLDIQFDDSGQGPINEPAGISSTIIIERSQGKRAHDIQCDDNSPTDNKSYSQECGESRGVTAGPYLVIAVLAALLGIALWLLL